MSYMYEKDKYPTLILKASQWSWAIEERHWRVKFIQSDPEEFCVYLVWYNHNLMVANVGKY